MGRARKRGLNPEQDREAAENLAANSAGLEVRGDAIRIDFMYDGKRCRETLKIAVTFANVEYAINKRMSIQQEIRQHNFDYATHFPESRKAGRSSSRHTTLREVYTRYWAIKAINVSEGTERRYAVALSACCESIGWSVPMSTIMPEEIGLLRAGLIVGRKPSTVNHYLATWNGLAVWAQENEYSERNLQAKFFRYQKNDPDPLELSEFVQIIEKGCMHPQDVALVTLAVYTGIRPGELCALAREDVDLKEKKLTVKRSLTDKDQLKVTKTGNERTIWLTPPALEAARALLDMTADLKPRIENIDVSRHQMISATLTPLVVPMQARNKGIAKGRLQVLSWATKWLKLLERAGVRRRVPYQSRHTYACWSLTAHGNIAFIAKQMGHKDYSMLVEVYGRWMDSESENESEFIWQELQKKGAFCPIIAPTN